MKYEFQSDVNNLLEIVINSLYSNKEIFLRELISNASDAITKRKINGKIEIKLEKNKIKIKDNGIGMNEYDLINYIGSIANSETKQNFISKTLIGNFGVGFYSSFLVSKTVEIKTKKENEESFIWRSDGKNEYVIEKCDKKNVGTTVILHLKDGLEEFSEELRIKNLVKQYLTFIKYPIILNGYVINYESKWETIEEEKINLLYTSFFGDGLNPFDCIIFNENGVKGVLYLSETPRINLYHCDYTPNEINLYSNGVFITNQLLIPRWLNFMKGFIEIDDLKLSISRENFLKANRKISEIVITNCVKMLNNMSEQKYKKFWILYGKNIKLGLYENLDENEDKLVHLLRFKCGDKLISLQEYISKSNENNIYYCYNIKYKIYLEGFENKLILSLEDPIDEMLLKSMEYYKQNDKLYYFVNLIYTDLSMCLDESYQNLLDDIKKCLKKMFNNYIYEVKLTNRLTKSPMILTFGKIGWNKNIEDILSKQLLNDKQLIPFMRSSIILEINPKHEIINKLKNNFDENLFKLLFDLTLLSCGKELINIDDFVESIYKIINYK